MKFKLAIAAALLAVTPAFAQAPAGPPPKMGPPQQQPPAPPKPTEAQVQKVVQTISADKTKIDAYCKLAKLQHDRVRHNETMEVIRTISKQVQSYLGVCTVLSADPQGMIGTDEVEFFGEPSISLSEYTM